MSDRERGFSLPEVMVAMLLVMLSASALISTMAATRMKATSNAKFSAASRLAIELSNWVRQGGMQALHIRTENPFDHVDTTATVPSCFSDPCSAEDAAIFYLHHWRRRLLLDVPDARIAVCPGVPTTSATASGWSCEEADVDTRSRFIKIGWTQGGKLSGSRFPPCLILALA